MIDSSPLLEMQLRGIHLTTVLANYQRLLSEHTAPLPYLSDLISLEAAKRQENGVKARIAAAHFPTLKTIESFDFTLQTELLQSQIARTFRGLVRRCSSQHHPQRTTRCRQESHPKRNRSCDVHARLPRALYDGCRATHETHRCEEGGNARAALSQFRSYRFVAHR